MRDPRLLLGQYLVGDTVWHRMGVGTKYLAFLLLTLPSQLVVRPEVSVATAVLSAVLVKTTGAPPRWAWGVPLMLVLFVAVLAGYHVLSGDPGAAVVVGATLLTALYSSRLVLLTTPMPALIDALVAFARPLRRVGLDPERFGLAVAIMVRSIPVLAGCVDDVRNAARARGIERNPLATVTPVVIQAVAYARTTGDALAARGLGDQAGTAFALPSGSGTRIPA